MAEGADQGQERTEDATPRRLDEARRKGQTARSRELTTTALLLSSSGAMFLLGPALVDDISAIMRESFVTQPRPARIDIDLFAVLLSALGEALLAVAPFLALTGVVAFLGPMALGGFNLSVEALAPKLDKLDPIKGLGRVFSWRGMMELLKAAAKFSLITGVAALVLWAVRDRVLALATKPIETALVDTVHVVSFTFLLLCASTIVIALIDVPFQLWSHARGLRMTRQEVREEMKDAEGKPEVKGRIRALQRELASRRMMADVPTADVIVTNPHRYAVALRYAPERMSAPFLVAKGRDEMAARIREVAIESGVPMVSAPPVARAIYHHTRLGREIPAGLYKAVAEILAYVLHLAEGARPSPLRADLPIPDDLRVDV